MTPSPVPASARASTASPASGTSAASASITALLATCATAVPGLYRTHPRHNLSAIAAHVVDAYRDSGSDRGALRLGRRRRLAVLAVDGLGYRTAALTLTPPVLEPLTSGFPTTTAACLLTSVTGRPADEHGVVGVQYLHADGRHAVDCHTGRLTAPTSAAPARPTRPPVFPTMFETLAALGVATIALPGALGGLSPPVRRRLLRGCRTVAPPPGGPAAGTGGLAGAVTAVLDAVRHLASTGDEGLTWAYLDLDSHIHRHGTDAAVRAACRAVDRFAHRLSRDGVAVLLYSDHGLARSAPGPATRAVWREADSPRWCRLPAGGAGRVRWLYPHAGERDRLMRWLAGRMPAAVVTTPDQLAAWGLIRAGSVGQRRLGEVVLLAREPDFPAADATAAFEHGSMTADELLVPLAIWHPD